MLATLKMATDLHTLEHRHVSCVMPQGIELGPLKPARVQIAGLEGLARAGSQARPASSSHCC